MFHNTVKSIIFITLYFSLLQKDPDYLSKRYQVGRKLGDGNFAIVKLGKRRDTNDQYALKIIEKSKLTGKEAMLLNEIHILHHCRHPNIVRLYEEFETASEIWLVMEFIKVSLITFYSYIHTYM